MAFPESLKKDFAANTERKHLPLYLSLIGVLLVLLVLDILSKYFAYMNLEPGRYVTAIPGLFNFTLTFNKGAAWGSLENQKWLLTTISLLAGTGVLLFYLVKFHALPRTVAVSLILIVAGAYGNLIDRIGYWAQLGIYKEGVVDFLQFAFWPSFPIFNLADSYLVVGIFVLVCYYLVTMIVDAIRKDRKTKDNAMEDEELKGLVRKHEDKENDDGKQL